jgi:phosphoenolpyruvate-protein phosphotransferase
MTIQRPDNKLSLGLLHKIIVDAASAHTLEEQIRSLVSAVRQAMDVDVCSLYRLEGSSQLRMIANVGLAEGVINTISMPINEGLVGKIARERVPLNLRIAEEHQDYRYFPHSEEEAFQAFLGVPIVHLGQVLGVLVVQDRDQRGFTDDEESFLTTIAAQLTGNLLWLPSAVVELQPTGQRRVEGTKGAGGQAIGHLQLVISAQTLHLIDEPESQGEVIELEILGSAIRTAQQDIASAKAQFNQAMSDEILQLFDFYSLMLENDQLTVSAEKRIRAGSSAFAAVRSTVDDHVAAFEAIEDAYLRARAEDVRHIGDKLLSVMLGEAEASVDSLHGVVLLGSMVSITDIARYRPEQLAGIICLQGSVMSHTAVVARALGIPAVMDTGPIDHIRSGDQVIVDGDSGQVLLNPDPETLESYQSSIEAARSFDDSLLKQKSLPALTTDGRLVALLANTGLLADINPGIQRGAEGIGLYRSEIPFLSRTSFPTEAEQLGVYRELLETYHPQPVVMRTLDVGGDKQLPYLAVVEENPALGWRGIRFTLDNRSILITQLRAMLLANAGLGNLKIMLPMVSAIVEVEEVIGILDTTIAQMQQDNIQVPRPSLGIMVEVPGVIPLLPHISPLIDFVSVGSNDLTQYLLAVDRANPYVSSRFDHLHPAVIHTLATIIDSAAHLDLELSVCGEMAADPYAVVLLLGLGVETLSMNAFSLPRIRALIRSLNFAEAQSLLRDVMLMGSPIGIRATIHQWLLQRDLGYLLGSASQKR